jgi:hypothetical protein
MIAARLACVALACACSAAAPVPPPAQESIAYERETETEGGAIRAWRYADDGARMAFELSYQLRGDEVVPGSVRVNLWAETLGERAGGTTQIRLTSEAGKDAVLAATVKDGIAAASVSASDLVYLSGGVTAVACEGASMRFGVEATRSLQDFSTRLEGAPSAWTGPPLKQCKKGCRCGNSCIACSKTCRK